MQIITLAARNIIRYWHRSLITIGAMAFGCGIMILFAALIEGIVRDSERNAITMNLGDIQIHRHGYRDDPDIYQRIDDSGELLARLHETGLLASRRLYGFGLMAAGTASAGVQVRAYDIEHEPQVTQLHEHLAQGQWLDPGHPQDIIIGRKLARTLGVGLGDEVVFVGQAADGSMANELYYIRGILKSVSEEIDRGSAYMGLEAFRQLMVIDDGAHEIAIMRPDRNSDLLRARQQVQALAPDLEVMDWTELNPLIARILDMVDAQTIVMIIITYVAVAMIVLNTMLMSVFERIREFGIMKAIGVGPWQIAMLILTESMLQTTLASLLALAGGGALSAWFSDHGIDLSHLAQEGATFGGIALDPIWRAHLNMQAVLLPILFLFLIALLAVIYPAIKAAVIRPVTAIHHR